MQVDTPPAEAVPQNHLPLNFKQWTLYIFLSGLPFIGLILLLVWAFGDEGNIHRKSWAQGMLLLYVLAIALAIVVMTIFGAGMFAFFNSQNY